MHDVLGTGLSGLIGSKLTQVFDNTYRFTNLDISNSSFPVDITQLGQVKKALENSPAAFVIHFAAFTDVTKAWEQRGDKNGSAYKVNVDGTKNIVKACEETQKHLIHISTAYVFDGEKTTPYTESDRINPIEWYGQTKAWAEEAVVAASCPWTILRIDQPFRSDPFIKQDIAHRLIHGLEQGTLPPLFTDHFFGPTFIDDFVKIIDWVMRTASSGIYHASSGEQWTDFEFGRTLQQVLELPGEIRPGKLATYLSTLQRPYQQNTALDCSLLRSKLDFKMLSIAESLAKIKK